MEIRYTIKNIFTHLGVFYKKQHNPMTNFILWYINIYPRQTKEQQIELRISNIKDH